MPWGGSLISWLHTSLYVENTKVNPPFLPNVIKQCVHCYFTRDPVLAIRRRLDMQVEGREVLQEIFRQLFFV